MIDDFIRSWALFQDSFLAGWLIAVLLALVGVLVVARDQIFIGAAVTQASTLGIALCMFAGVAWEGSALGAFATDAVSPAWAIGFSIAAALFTGRAAAAGRESHEATTGWVFLVSSSLSILVLAKSPHGLEEIHRLLSSSIIGAERADVWNCAALTAVTILAVAVSRSRLILFAMDPEMAAAVGLRTRAWAFGTSAWLGLCVGIAIRTSGMLYTFSCLVLPALVAKNVCREVRQMFVVAPVVALLCAVSGFVVANAGDYPPAQMTSFLLCGALLIAWGVRWFRHRVVGAR